MSDFPLYTEVHADLVERCKAGENTAFKEIYHLYCKAMFNSAMRILNKREEAEDVLQESFISAFKNIQQYSGKVSFGSWLKRIVINRSIDTLKKRNINLLPIAERDIVQEEPDEPDTDFLSIESIKEVVRQLPDGYRLVITLYLFEEYPHKKIAEKLGISEGTSKSQYARARKKLMELIRLRTGKNE